MRLTHTKESLKLFEFLEKHANQWNSVANDKKTQKALKRLLFLYPIELIEYDAFTNQVYLNSKVEVSK